MQTQHCSQFLHTRETMPAILNSNYIASTHSIHTLHDCTSTCTTHPALPSQLPSTALLRTQLTNTKHSWQNGTRCRNGFKCVVVSFPSCLIDFEGFHPYLRLFSFRKRFCNFRSMLCSHAWCGKGTHKTTMCTRNICVLRTV